MVTWSGTKANFNESIISIKFANMAEKRSGSVMGGGRLA